MVQLLRALAALTRDLGIVPSTNILAHNSSSRDLIPSLNHSSIKYMSGSHTHACRQNIHMHKKNPNKQLRCFNQAWWPSCNCSTKWEETAVPYTSVVASLAQWSSFRLSKRPCLNKQTNLRFQQGKTPDINLWPRHTQIHTNPHMGAYMHILTDMLHIYNTTHILNQSASK